LNKKNIAILGSTGSVGTQALEVIECFPDHFSVSVLTIGKNADLLIQQVQRFHPKIVVVGDESAYQKVKTALKNSKTEVWFGQQALSKAVELDEIDIVLTAIVGSAGLEPTLTAIENGKDIALANKETLVVAGQLINELVAKKGVKLLPVDSEHSAIFQCLTGEESNPIEKNHSNGLGRSF